MNEQAFEGTLVLEKLAEIDKIEEFYLAIDSDDLSEVRRLMKQAGIDAWTIALVLKKIENGDE